MKAIVSLFISAYQPGMTSIECRYFKDPYFEDRYLEKLHFEEAYFESQHLEDPSYEDICWMRGVKRHWVIT